MVKLFMFRLPGLPAAAAAAAAVNWLKFMWAALLEEKEIQFLRCPKNVL